MKLLEGGATSLGVDQVQAVDLTWLEKHLATRFWPAARVGYELTGRGAVVIDTSSEKVAGEDGLFGYFSQAIIDRDAGEVAQRLTEAYNPYTQFVAIFLKPENREHCYRLAVEDELAEAFRNFGDFALT